MIPRILCSSSTIGIRFTRCQHIADTQLSSELSAEQANTSAVMQSLTCVCGILAPSAMSLIVMSREVMIPIKRPALSTTGIAPSSVWLIRRAARSILSSGLNVDSQVLIKSRALRSELNHLGALLISCCSSRTDFTGILEGSDGTTEYRVDILSSFLVVCSPELKRPMLRLSRKVKSLRILRINDQRAIRGSGHIPFDNRDGRTRRHIPLGTPLSRI
jgi:hypothetical protein